MNGLPGLNAFGMHLLKKPKAMKGLKTLGGHQQGQEPMPSLDHGPERTIDVVPPDLIAAERALGDVNLAKRILKLRAQYCKTTSGTIPELLVMDWLNRQHQNYLFQYPLFGGRMKQGGQVVDFAVDTGAKAIIIEVQGIYFHSTPGKVQFDEAERLALLGVQLWGKPVSLVEVWESRLVTPVKERREAVMRAAMQGEELGR